MLIKITIHQCSLMAFLSGRLPGVRTLWEKSCQFCILKITNLIGIICANYFSEIIIMPKIAIYKFLTFFIYSFDVFREPPHLHIVKEKGLRQKSAKIWLRTLEIAEKGTLTDTDINPHCS